MSLPQPGSRLRLALRLRELEQELYQHGERMDELEDRLERVEQDLRELEDRLARVHRAALKIATDNISRR